MNPKALKSLEYYKIIDQLTEKASSQMGKEMCIRDRCKGMYGNQTSRICNLGEYPERA